MNENGLAAPAEAQKPFQAAAPFPLPSYDAIDTFNRLRFRTCEDGTSHDLKVVQDFHREIINLHIKGYTNVQVAEMMGAHEKTVARALNSRIVQDQVAALRRERSMQALATRDKLEEGARKAIELMADFVADPAVRDDVRLKAADSLLDREGSMPKVSKTETKSTVSHYIGIEQIKRLVSETSNNPNLDAVDAEFLEIEDVSGELGECGVCGESEESGEDRAANSRAVHSCQNSESEEQ